MSRVISHRNTPSNEFILLFYPITSLFSRNIFKKHVTPIFFFLILSFVIFFHSHIFYMYFFEFSNRYNSYQIECNEFSEECILIDILCVINFKLFYFSYFFIFFHVPKIFSKNMLENVPRLRAHPLRQAIFEI